MALFTPMETMDARDAYFLTRIESITEADFWSSIQTTGDAASADLRKAVKAGRAGQMDEAYRALGACHAKTLAGDAERARAAAKASLANPKAAARLRAQADAVLRHDIKLWHETRMQFGSKIDFTPDVTSSVMYGYHYLGWLNPLGQLAIASGDTRDRDGWLDIVEQYYEARTRVPWVMSWWSPVYYELGARAKAEMMLPVYAAICDDDAVTTSQREAILKLLLGFARSLYRMQTDEDYRPGNWQIGGCRTLYHIGSAFPEFKESGKWRAIAARLMKEHAQRDFFADGGDGERNWSYGFISLRTMQAFYEIAKRYGRLDAADERFWNSFLKRSYQWFAKTMGPQETMLCYGDGVLGPGANVRSHAKRLFPKWATTGDMCGIDRSKSYLLEPSGFAVMRGGGGDKERVDDGLFASINFGPFAGVHSHEEQLAFTLWGFGQPLIEEVGRFGDYDIPLNPMFKSRESHNQVVVEHLPMRRQVGGGKDGKGGELTGEDIRGQDVVWHSDDRVDFFSAWHEAFPEHRIQRMIVMLKPGCMVVYDVITTSKCMRQISHFLHACKPFDIVGPGRARIVGSPSCLVQLADAGSLREFSTRPDYVEADYGSANGNSPHLDHYPHSLERHRLTSRRWHDTGRTDPITFATLLLPFNGSRAPKASITSLAVKGDDSQQVGAFRIDTPAGSDVVVFNPERAAVRVERRDVNTIASVWRGNQRTDIGG